MNAGFQVIGDAVTLSDPEQKHVSSNSVSTNSQPEEQTEKRTAEPEKKISAITRRDIMDKLCSWAIEGRLGLIEFLEMTWPNLSAMPSPSAGMSLAYEISLIVD